MDSTLPTLSAWLVGSFHAEREAVICSELGDMFSSSGEVVTKSCTNDTLTAQLVKPTEPSVNWQRTQDFSSVCVQNRTNVKRGRLLRTIEVWPMYL